MLIGCGLLLLVQGDHLVIYLFATFGVFIKDLNFYPDFLHCFLTVTRTKENDLNFCKKH